MSKVGVPFWPMEQRAFHIGEVARQLDLSFNTIRHWDETGLAPPSGRSPGRFRLYTESDIERMAFIKRFRPLGFGLEQIREVLEVRDALMAGDGHRELPAMRELLADYITTAKIRCSKLRSDLAAAEDFVADLVGMQDHLRQAG